MTALVIPLMRPQHHPAEVATQEYILAKRHCREVIERFDARFEECVRALDSAFERRTAAFQRYVVETMRLPPL